MEEDRKVEERSEACVCGFFLYKKEKRTFNPGEILGFV